MFVKPGSSGRAWRRYGRQSRNANTSNAISYPDEPGLRKPDSLHFFRIFKEQPNKTYFEVEIRLFHLEVGFFQKQITGGANRDRTGDLLLAKQALSQLSYGPCKGRRKSCGQLVGLGGLEPPTPRLSSVCSNQLSYRPVAAGTLHFKCCTADRCGRENERFSLERR